MKTCPFCAEQVQSEAIKCKHCGSALNNRIYFSLNYVSFDGKYKRSNQVGGFNKEEVISAFTKKGHKVASIWAKNIPQIIFDREANVKCEAQVRKSENIKLLVIIVLTIAFFILVLYASQSQETGGSYKSSDHTYYSKDEIRAIARNTGTSEERVRETIASLPAGTPKNWSDFDN